TADPPSGAPGRGWFRDTGAAAGLVFVHEMGMTAERHLPETMGAGAALADLDGDDDLDAYLLQGGPFPPGAPVPGGGPRPVDRLFLGDGRGRFEDATQRSGDAAHDGYSMGCALGDADGDGDLDLYVTNFGPDVLLLNDGHARFTDGTSAAGLGDERWTTACTFFDPDADGDQDLFVTGYVEVDPAHPLWCGERRDGWRSYCHPDAYPGLPPRFWRNEGGGRFREATREAGLERPPDDPGKGLGAIALDVEGDGDLDLYVANDSVENKLWLGRGDGTFDDGTLLSGTGVDGTGRTEAGMGLATGDVDGDLDLEIFVTNFDDESNTLYRNDADALFTDVTTAAGLDAPSRLLVGFGTVLCDLDNDGDLDLAVANGHIIDNIHLYNDGKRWKQPAQLFVNDGRGRFADGTARAGDLSREPLVGRGLYAGDVDGDGDADLLLTQCGGRALLLANDGPPGGALHPSVVLSGLLPGTRVLARTDDGRRLLREAGTQTSYFGACAPDVILGLQGAALVELRLRPPGRAEVVLPVAPPLHSGTLRFTAGAEAPRRLPPGSSR
ncbi:MAG: CRTAC1 family protein, partial [Planctomycetes bacterium]|nr:CRTAC1 family protein [Planctomycetota bacterium]